jgi:hypothetical protein
MGNCISPKSLASNGGYLEKSGVDPIICISTSADHIQAMGGGLQIRADCFASGQLRQ